MTYAEYLKSQGASEDEVKILATPVAEKAYTSMQASLAAERSRADAAENGKKTYAEWYEKQAVPYVQKLEREIVVSKAEEGRARAALMTLQERGLVDVAKDLGYKLENQPGAGQPPANQPPAFDASKYVTTDVLQQVAAREGDAIAAAQDIAIEHAYLFGNDATKKLNFREMRQAAIQQGKSVEQVWMDRFGVEGARAARATADKESYEKRLREEGAAAVRQEFADRMGNPDARPLLPSRSPLAPRADTGREKQPWEMGDRQNDRVQRATRKVVDQALGGGNYGRAN
jgi:hypothetical protein